MSELYLINTACALYVLWRCVNNFPDIKALMMVIETETFNVDFTSQ